MKFKNTRCWYYNLKETLYNAKCRRKYPDYVNDSYNCGSLKHIWGIKSGQDLSGQDANLYTLNDIDITYDRDTCLYLLSIETAYVFENKQDECKYLKGLLVDFDVFMDVNDYSKTEPYCLFMNNLSLSYKASSIPELYTQFRLFVEGFCAINNDVGGLDVK